MRHILLASIAGNFANKLKVTCKTNKVDLNATFITTAANLYKKKQWMEDDIKLFEKAGFYVNRVDLNSLTKEEFKKELNKTNICIMGGGNPIYLLEIIKKKGVTKYLQKRVDEGMFYVGSSAGAVIASPNIELEKHFEDRKSVTPLESYNSLNLVDFQVLPHWGKSSFEKQYMKMLQNAYKKEETVISLRDDQAIEIMGDQMKLISE